jgi:hypothetical protein
MTSARATSASETSWISDACVRRRDANKKDGGDDDDDGVENAGAAGAGRPTK